MVFNRAANEPSAMFKITEKAPNMATSTFTIKNYDLNVGVPISCQVGAFSMILKSLQT